MPLGSARLTLFAKPAVVEAEAEVIRKKVGVVANGNAQIDTAQSEFGGASGLFDGTGDYLGIYGATMSYSDDFTIEGWINLDVLPSASTFRMIYAGNSNTEYASIANQGGTYVSNLVIRNSGGTLYETYYTIPSISTGTWYHWAIVKNGATIKHFFDGTELTTLYSSSGTMGSDFGFDGIDYIARWNGNTSHMFDGYLDEMRVSKTARYTAGFTPSTTPFVNDSNTLLLLHMDGTDGSTFFEDDNGTYSTTRTAVTTTAVNDVTVSTTQSKFGGASADFDGTGDHILTDSAISLNGTGDFTVECWFRTDDVSTSAGIIDFRVTGSTNPAPIIYFSSSNVYWFAAGANRIQSGSGGTAQTLISTNTWYHLAVVRSSGSTKMYIDGTNVGVTYTDSNDYPSNIATIGDNYSLSAPYGGYIDELRVSETARYTANFTAPVAPFKNDNDTLLLLHMNGEQGNTVFNDDNTAGRSAVGVIGNGSIAIDTAQSYFGGSSCLSTGSADSLLFDGSLIPLSGDFTIESWVRFTGTASRKMLYSQYTTSTGRTSMEIGTDEKASFFCASQASFQEADRILGDSALSVDTWYHIAVVRDGSTFTMYIDGVAQADTITHSVNVQDQDFEIFGDDFGTHTDDVWQDEFRISDTARYTTGFTAPTEPFVNDNNTILLLHMDGTDAGTDFRDDNGIGRSSVGVSAEGNAQVDTAQSKFGGASALFDGSSDYLYVPGGQGIDDSSTDFTLEAFVRFDILPQNQTIGGGSFMMFATVGSTTYISFDSHDGSKIRVQVADSGTYMNFDSTTTNWATGTWYHVAIVRESNQYDVYVDGVALPRPATSTKAGGWVGAASNIIIGKFTDSRGSFDGNMDEFRISDTARYTSGFTAPTEPFQNDANTLLLLHMDGTDGSTVFIDDNGKQA